jgi:hypothetical protein
MRPAQAGKEGKMAAPTKLPVTLRGTKPRPLLDGLANVLGPLTPEFKSRLRAVIENPTSETWERAYAILVRPDMTLWRAVILVDPTFPTTGPGGPRGRRNPWLRVPDQLLLVRAIRYAASGKLSRARVAYLAGQPPDGP